MPMQNKRQLCTAFFLYNRLYLHNDRTLHYKTIRRNHHPVIYLQIESPKYNELYCYQSDSIIQNSPCKVLHNLHKNEIYLFTHAGGGDLMKKFQKNRERKKSLAALALFTVYRNPYKISCRRHYRKAARYRLCRRSRSGGSRRWGTGCTPRGGRCRRCPRCRRP